MKKLSPWMAALLLWSIPCRMEAKEFLIRLGNEFGLLTQIHDHVIHGAVRRHTFLNPEVHLEYQIIGRWFATASFHYVYLIGRRSDRIDIFAPTAGFKIVSFEDTPVEGDLFDRSRWWLNLEAGPYLTSSKLNAIIPRGTQTDFGFNASGGFDAFLHQHWGAGLQVKMHYAHYNPDDYLLVTFGPHLIFRF